MRVGTDALTTTCQFWCQVIPRRKSVWQQNLCGDWKVPGKKEHHQLATANQTYPPAKVKQATHFQPFKSIDNYKLNFLTELFEHKFLLRGIRKQSETKSQISDCDTTWFTGENEIPGLSASCSSHWLLCSHGSTHQKIKVIQNEKLPYHVYYD